jgi:hypothetical protein
MLTIVAGVMFSKSMMLGGHMTKQQWVFLMGSRLSSEELVQRVEELQEQASRGKRSGESGARYKALVENLNNGVAVYEPRAECFGFGSPFGGGILEPEAYLPVAKGIGAMRTFAKPVERETLGGSKGTIELVLRCISGDVTNTWRTKAIP